jgi:diguanylate cyclase (GGDEF)-like protein
MNRRKEDSAVPIDDRLRRKPNYYAVPLVLVLLAALGFADYVRMGGDEFAALFPGSDFETSDAMLKRIRDHVSAEMTGNGWQVTLSVGAITYLKPDASMHEMIRRADDLMYGVKKSGKNNIEHVTSG